MVYMPTKNQTRSSYAKVKVKVDLTSKVPQRVRITKEDDDTGECKSKWIKVNMITCQSTVRNVVYKDMIRIHVGLYIQNCMRKKKGNKDTQESDPKKENNHKEEKNEEKRRFFDK